MLENNCIAKVVCVTMPCFLSNDLELRGTCFPPEAAVTKGRHRVVRITSGGGGSLSTPRQISEDEWYDNLGNLLS